MVWKIRGNYMSINFFWKYSVHLVLSKLIKELHLLQSELRFSSQASVLSKLM